MGGGLAIGGTSGYCFCVCLGFMVLPSGGCLRIPGFEVAYCLCVLRVCAC